MAAACISDPDALCHIDVGGHGPREVHDHCDGCPFKGCDGCRYQGESQPVVRGSTQVAGRLGSAPNGATPAGNGGLTTDCMGVTMADSQHTDRTTRADRWRT